MTKLSNRILTVWLKIQAPAKILIQMRIFRLKHHLNLKFTLLSPLSGSVIEITNKSLFFLHFVPFWIRLSTFQNRHIELENLIYHLQALINKLLLHVNINNNHLIEMNVNNFTKPIINLLNILKIISIYSDLYSSYQSVSKEFCGAILI